MKNLQITCKDCCKVCNITKFSNHYLYWCMCEPNGLMKHVYIPDHIPSKQHRKYMKEKYGKTEIWQERKMI
jgi:hypothetical protein